MSNLIKEKLVVRASAPKVFQALTEQAGYNGWWSKDCQIGRKPGDESKLKFNKDGNIVSMRFRLDETAPTRSVRWTCTGHDMPSWIGTTLKWNLLPDADETEVSFEHAGWQGDAPEPVRQGWRHFLGSLRSYVETGQGQPW
jgi:uncharacterized protein YndB with AHSA1/START domain